MWFEKFGFQWYSYDWKLDILKPGISDWPSNDGKMTSHNNFKLRFSRRSLDLVTGFLFQFGVIWEVWPPWVLIALDIVKQGMSDWPGNERKITSHSNFKLRFSKKCLDLVRGFQYEFDVNWEVWLPWVLIWLKIGHCKARNVRLAGQRRKNDVTQKLQA